MNVLSVARKFWLKNNDKIEFVAGVTAVAVGTFVLIKSAEKINDVTT